MINLAVKSLSWRPSSFATIKHAMDTLALLRAGQLTGITRLDLSCGLTEFPEEIFDLADSLEVLNLTGNALSSLPDDLSRLHKLRVLFCSENRFTELPACIGHCSQLQIIGFKANQIRQVPAAALPPSLRWLILTDNCVESLPDALSDCHALQKLMRCVSLPTASPNCPAGC
jgi:Leucine-rich repeat (LRR) protein